MYLKQIQSIQKKSHAIHNDYPLAPEKINITKEGLSKYCLKIASVYNINTGTVKKLVPNLMNKDSYLIHYRNLEQCLELGMKLKKIHSILKSKQSDWDLILILTHKKERCQLMNLIIIFFKLMNNSVYGETMENLRKKIKISVVKNSQGFIKYTSRPHMC